MIYQDIPIFFIERNTLCLETSIVEEVGEGVRGGWGEGCCGRWYGCWGEGGGRVSRFEAVFLKKKGTKFLYWEIFRFHYFEIFQNVILVLI